MNATDLFQSLFDSGAVARLAQSVGLAPAQAARALEAGVPLQLQALAEGARTPAGERLVVHAVEALPSFASVGAALDELGGAGNLQQTGKLLTPVLLGDAASTLPAQVAEPLAADPARVQVLLQMALPMLISRLGQHGLKAGNIAPVLAGLGLDHMAAGNVILDKAEPGDVQPGNVQPGKSESDPQRLQDLKDRDSAADRGGAALGGAVAGGVALGGVALAGAGALGAGALDAVSSAEVPLPPAPGAPVVPVPAGPDASVPGVLVPEASTPDVSVPDSPALAGPELKGLESAHPTPAPNLLSKVSPPESSATDASLSQTDPLVPAVLASPTDAGPAMAALSVAAPAVAAPAGAVPAAPVSEGTTPVPPAADPSTPEGLLAYLQERFGGSVGQQVGAVAGFGGGSRRQAAVAALPVVLAALVGQAQTGSGATEAEKLRNMARPFEGLTGADGHLQAGLLDSPVEVARIEGQGRGLLGSLFGDLNSVTGRLGSALGGSGDSSRRLLALMTPLVLSVLTRAHPEGSGVLGGLLGRLGSLLPAMLPAGLSSLGVVVGSLVNRTPLPGAVSVSGVPAVAAAQAATSAPPPSRLKPPRPTSVNSLSPPLPPPPAPQRRGNPLLWLVPVLLLGLGGCWLLQNRAATPATATTTGDTATGDTASAADPSSSAFAITEPQGGAAVAASGFPISGTGPAGEALNVFRGEAQVGTLTVGQDGTWSTDVVDAAAPPGAQTYAVKNAAGAELGSVDVEVGAADTTPAATTSAATAPVNPVPVTPAPVNPAPVTSAPAATDTAAAVVISEPVGGAQMAAGGLTLRGTGPAGANYALFQNGLRAGSVTVGADGTWKADIAAGAALPGPQNYDLRDDAGQVAASVKVQVGSGDQAAGTPTGSGTTPASPAGITVGSPASGAQVADAGFALSGTGTAGQTFEVLEDGVSIGSFTVGADGQWTRQVPAPSAGAKTYVIRDASGKDVASLPLTVAAAAAGTQGAACTQPLSLSLNDGDTVTAPYRFGGVGDASAYNVTVKRGERVIGTKTVQVSAGCAWSYTSNPGGAQVTYEVRPAEASASDPAAASLTLNIR